MFPPLPGDWSGLHPLIIHFPIALLFIAPLLVVIGLAFKGGRHAYLVSALLLMAVGTLATYVAVSTGEAAGELAEGFGPVGAMLERHEGLAETTRAVFTVLTLVFAGLLAVPKLMKREMRGPIFYGAHVMFLVAYLFGAGLLANTAHEGGMLVHQSGVRAMVAAAPAGGGGTGPGIGNAEPATGSRDGGGEREADDDD